MNTIQARPQRASSVRHVLDIFTVGLAKPWVYRRNGVYYLRVRPKGSKAGATLSLRTSDRPTAMATKRDILKALDTFHLNRPDATWGDLKARLLEIAEGMLSTAMYEEDDRVGFDLHYGELLDGLDQASLRAPLSIDQFKALELGRQIIKAAQERIQGRPEALAEIIQFLQEEPMADRGSPKEAPQAVAREYPSPSLSVCVPSDSARLTFEALSELFLKERQGNVTDSTLKAVASNCRTLSGLIGDLDLRTHTRADMVALKEKVVEGRKPLTINKLMTQLSTVMTWATENGYLERSYEKGLKIERGAESTRRPFSRDEVATIMAHVNSLPVDDWKRWALSLGVLTGARVGEIYQLTKSDVRSVDGVTIIDINKDEKSGKTLKTPFSVRLIPLVDGAYGFSLAAFLEWVESSEGKLFKEKRHYFDKPLNEALRAPLGLKAGSNQSFHSLRHSLSGLLKAAATPDVIAQSITGHSSGNITYDLYGGTQRVDVKVTHEALKKAFGIPQSAPEENAQ